MSTTLASQTLPRRGAFAALPPPLAAACAVTLGILGLFSIWSTLAALRDMWLTDGLKSIGMVIPIVSLLLILRVWRSLGWEMQGTWAGLAILLATIAAVRVRDHAILLFVVSPEWSLNLPPHSLVVFAYGSGLVLLFGGTRLYKAALFPILFLWLVNPVPHIFNVLVDLPLQHASAHIARSFAHALGQPLTSDQLSLMFTPQFGMFIAPGCNGIRGAVTMGLIALIAGYLYRFRLLPHILFVASAIFLGYLFNFVRLCTLVIYYIVALHLPRLQNHGEMADYYIGGALFLIGTMLLAAVMRRARQVASLTLPPQPDSESVATPPSFYPRLAAMLAIVILSAAPFAHAHPVTSPLTQTQPAHEFPEQVGQYRLTRSWNDTLPSGVFLYHWGEYTRDGSGQQVSVGVSPVLGAHDTMVCHSARGEDPLWHDQMTLPTAGSGSIAFSGSFFNSGATQYLEATTLCNGTSCGEFSSSGTHFGFVYSKPDTNAMLRQSPLRSIPVMIRTEMLDPSVRPEIARQQLTETLRNFVSSADLDTFTLPYRQ
jgi:exosortase J